MTRYPMDYYRFQVQEKQKMIEEHEKRGEHREARAVEFSLECLTLASLHERGAISDEGFMVLYRKLQARYQDALGSIGDARDDQ